MADTIIAAAHHALLIGLTFYPGDPKPPKGSVNDVCNIQEHLASSREKINIRLLTSSPRSDGAFGPREDEDDLATHKNVLYQLRDIMSRASEGDFVYVHFSGHGTATSPRCETRNDTGDLALVLLDDTDRTQPKYLWGADLAEILHEMVEQKLSVTLVLDCCFSGSVVRDDESVRFLPYDPVVGMRCPLVRKESHGSEDDTAYRGARDASMRPSWLVDPEGYSIIAACGPSQLAKEVGVEGKFHGALSYFLLRTFLKLGRVGGRQQNIYTHLCARFQEKGLKQKPMLYGNKHLWFFEEASGEYYASPIPIASYRSGSARAPLELQAGQAHGVREGDRFFLSYLETREVNPGNEQDPVIFEVTHAGPLVSNLKIVDDTRSYPNSGMTGTAHTHLAVRRFPVCLDIRLPCRETWESELRQWPSLNVCFKDQADDETRFAFHVAIIAKKGYEIRDLSNQIITGLPETPYNLEENASFVLDIIKHLARFKMVRELANPYPTPAFKESFQVELLNLSSGERFNPGCKHGGAFQPICSHSDCIVPVKHGTKLEIRLHNKLEAGETLCVHIYAMSSSWEIANILKADHATILPSRSNKSADFEQGTDGPWTRKIKMVVPKRLTSKGQTECEDIIKIFVTRQQTSFACLELPEIGTLIKSGKPSPNRGDDEQDESEDWTVLDFRIRTTI